VAWSRWVLVLLLLAPVLWPERAAIVDALSRRRREFVPFALLGFAPQNVAIYLGLYGSSATNLALLNSFIPVQILLIGWVAFGRRPHLLEGIGLALSFLGVWLVLGRGDLAAPLRLDLNPWDLLIIVGLGIWSVYTLRLRDRPPGLSLLGFVFVCALIGVLVAAPIAAAEIAWRGVPQPGLRDLAGLVYIAVLPTLAAMWLFGFGVERVGPVQAGYFTHLVPVFGSLLAAAILGEALRPYHGVAFLLVAGGAIVSCLRQDRVLTSRLPTARDPAREQAR
jgi:drug/metabolite transporter (DMT)-like permease